MPNQNESGSRETLRRAGFELVVRTTIESHGTMRYELKGSGTRGTLYVSAPSEAEAWGLAVERAHHHLAIGRIET